MSRGETFAALSGGSDTLDTIRHSGDPLSIVSHSVFRREWYGWTFGEVLGKLMAWLELDEEQTLNLALGLTEDGRFRDESGV